MESIASIDYFNHIAVILLIRLYYAVPTILTFPSTLTMVLPWPGYILYPLYAHKPILEILYVD